MLKHIIPLLFILFGSNAVFGQSFTLKGRVTDPEDTPLESATIYLTRVKDSAVVDYTISASDGNWELKTRSTTDSIDLKISYISFTDYRLRLPGINADRDFGTVKMADLPTELNEVVVEGEIPPIRIKKDTVEFNASSFKVRPDANVESLLKQLPGVTVDTDGKITVNGKEVSKILVNGKPFFDESGQIALKNLPAEIIDKVQVSDAKTTKEELTGEKASGDNASINLTIQEDKNKGLFGKVMGGYGTDDRYEASFIFNYFKGNRRVSILSSSNNINSPGFSMNELFDGMMGGRGGYNFSGYGSIGSSFSFNGVQFGGTGSGITKSNVAGVNYSDELIKDFDSTVSYFYTTSDTQNDNRTSETTFLAEDEDDPEADRSIISESINRSEQARFTHNITGRFRTKIDSTATINFDPKFSRTNATSSSNSAQTTVNQDNELLNESNGTSWSDTNNTTAGGSLTLNRRFNKKRRYLAVSLNGNTNRDDDEQYTISNNTFYNDDENNDGLPDVTTDNRNQLQRGRRENNSYSAEIEFNEPLTDSLRLAASLEYRYSKSIDDNSGFSYNEETGGYTDQNDLITNYLQSGSGNLSPAVRLRYQHRKFNYNLSAGTDITNLSASGTYFGTNYAVEKNYLLPNLSARIDYQLMRSKSIGLNYYYTTSLPSAQQLLPIQDVSNPLYTRTGNPDLDVGRGHSISADIRNYDYSTRTGYSAGIRSSFYESSIVSITTIDDSAKRTTTYTNLGGNYNLSTHARWDKSFKREANTLRVGGSFNTSLSHNRGFNNGNLYESDAYYIRPSVNFTWEYGELLNINTNYGYTYNETQYKNYAVDGSSYSTHNVSLQTTSYWPKHVVFGNDVSFRYNTRLGSGFRNDSYLWNISLGYNFFNDKLLFKAKVYDVLKQNIGTSRNITDTSITDQQNSVLTRYMMFSLTYTLSKFATNSNEPSGSGRGRGRRN